MLGKNELPLIKKKKTDNTFSNPDKMKLESNNIFMANALQNMLVV